MYVSVYVRFREMRDRAIYYYYITRQNVCSRAMVPISFFFMNLVVITAFFILALLGTFGLKTDAIIHHTPPTHHNMQAGNKMRIYLSLRGARAVRKQIHVAIIVRTRERL